MTFTYVLATDIGKLRLNLRDTDGSKKLFEDEELQVFLDRATASGVADLYLATAEALDSLASNAALLHKMVRIGDYQVDSKGMADALRKAAAIYREHSEETPTFEVAEQALTIGNWFEILDNDSRRSG